MDIGKGVQEGLNQTSAAQKVGTPSSIEKIRSQEMTEKSVVAEKIPKSSTIVTTVAVAAKVGAKVGARRAVVGTRAKADAKAATVKAVTTTN